MVSRPSTQSLGTAGQAAPPVKMVSGHAERHWQVTQAEVRLSQCAQCLKCTV